MSLARRDRGAPAPAATCSSATVRGRDSSIGSATEEPSRTSCDARFEGEDIWHDRSGDYMAGSAIPGSRTVIPVDGATKPVEPQRAVRR